MRASKSRTLTVGSTPSLATDFWANAAPAPNSIVHAIKTLALIIVYEYIHGLLHGEAVARRQLLGQVDDLMSGMNPPPL